jgi:uncharacterized protein (TIGR02118 family)
MDHSPPDRSTHRAAAASGFDMIKRVSLVWKRPELSDQAFREVWLGEHANWARQLPGLQRYSIDFVTEAPHGAPAGIATVVFANRQALDQAFADPKLKAELQRTRDDFASAVQVLFVDECVVV